MPEFLNLLPPAQALQILLDQMPATPPPVETVETKGAFGRVTARPVLARENLPAFDRSTVDGYAVRARDTFGASDSLPAFLRVAGEVPMGNSPAFTLKAGQAGLIHTGGMLPDDADGVVMVEHTQPVSASEIEVLRAVGVGENVLKTGEDVTAGDEVLPAGRALRAADIGGLLALGYTRVEVAARPRVAILSSGDEVVPVDAPLRPGQVRDINSHTLAVLIRQAGGEPVHYGILPDDAGALEGALRRAKAENAGVVITAGSSASTRDLTAGVIARLGPPGVLVHGVNVRPGKPTLLAVCDGTPVIGLPGNPVSALVIAYLFLVPVIERLLGMEQPALRPSVWGRLTINLPSQAGREEFLPARLSSGPQGRLVEPVFFKSNLIFTLAQADGLLHVPADATGLDAGNQVEVLLL